jgi:hypothetical protein
VIFRGRPAKLRIIPGPPVLVRCSSAKCSVAENQWRRSLAGRSRGQPGDRIGRPRCATLEATAVQPLGVSVQPLNGRAAAVQVRFNTFLRNASYPLMTGKIEVLPVKACFLLYGARNQPPDHSARSESGSRSTAALPLAGRLGWRVRPGSVSSFKLPRVSKFPDVLSILETLTSPTNSTSDS